MEIYSIGFTQKSAAQFFGALRAAGIRRLMDVRLNNTSQLAAFAKASDLPYFRWMEHLNLLPCGIYPHATFAAADTETWLTISLSEPYYGFHYKLVAAVIVRAS
jgi:hypothetical protein